MSPEDWDPALYARFAAERLRPFHDLLSLLPPRLGPRWLDLGCGDGRPTRTALDLLGDGSTTVLGVDGSAAMLARAAEDGRPGCTWIRDDLTTFVTRPGERYDLVLSNAALHWAPDHPRLVPALLGRVAPGGWLALQMPMNHTAPSHLAMAEVAVQERFATALEGFAMRWPQREPEDYRGWLLAAGFAHVVVELRTYRHPLPDLQAIAAWTRSAGMRPWLDRLRPELREPFVAAYVDALAEHYPPVDAAGTRLLDYRRLLVVGRARGPGR